MKLTYEVPGILIDNTKGEAITEMVTKTSESLQQSGTFLVSEGNGDYALKTFGDVTGSLIHKVIAESPLKVNITDPIRPVVYLGSGIPVTLGGTGKSAVENDKFLYGKNGLYKFVNIVGSGNDWIEVTKDVNDNTVIKSTITNTVQGAKKFLASGISNPSAPNFRTIVSSDLPNTIENKTLNNVETSGSHEGTFSGSFEGDGSGLHSINVGNFAGILTVANGGTGKNSLVDGGLLIGNGTDPVKTYVGNSADNNKFLMWNNSNGSFLLSKLSSSYFNDFDGDIYNHLSGGSGINISQQSNKVVISAGLSTVLTKGSITGSGELGNEIDLKPNVTASNLTILNNLFVNGTASIAFLETLEQQSLQIGDKYITILSGGNDHTTLDGAGILWGSGSTDGTTGDQQSVAYVLYRGIGIDTDYIQIFPGLRVSGSLSSSNGITGSFSGDGSGLSGIPSTAVDLNSLSSSFATLAGVTASFTTPIQVSGALDEFLSTGVYTTFAQLSGGNSLTGSQFIDGLVSASSGFTGSFSGDGTSIINISGLNWGPAHNFQTDVRNQLSNGANLNYTTGTFALKDAIKLSSVTASFSGSGFRLLDLTGSNWGPTHSFRDDVWDQFTDGANLTYNTGTYMLNDDIQLNSVSASFSGSGFEVYDITSSNIQNFTKDVHEKFVAESNLTYNISSLSASYKLNDNIELNSVTSSFKGDGSGLLSTYPKVKFTTTDDVGIEVGHAVALTSTGLKRSDKSAADPDRSNFIGIVVHSASGELYVQTGGEADMRSDTIQGSFTTGTTLWVHHAGHAGVYSQIDPGEYATQIGYISGNGPYRIIIQPRVFGQIA